MRYFRKIELDWLSSARSAITGELSQHDDAWLANQTRQQRIKVQRHTQSIWLRFANNAKKPGKIVDDVHASQPSQRSAFFPTTMALFYRFASDLSGDMVRAIVVRLAPNSVVYPHIDHGEYYKLRDRYHFVIDSPTGSRLKSGDEDVTMQQGELWCFDNKAMHDSRNISETWRVHVIFDLRPLPGGGENVSP